MLPPDMGLLLPDFGASPGCEKPESCLLLHPDVIDLLDSRAVGSCGEPEEFSGDLVLPSSLAAAGSFGRGERERGAGAVGTTTSARARLWSVPSPRPPVPGATSNGALAAPAHLAGVGAPASLALGFEDIMALLVVPPTDLRRRKPKKEPPESAFVQS